jgi:hypothetical protein
VVHGEFHDDATSFRRTVGGQLIDTSLMKARWKGRGAYFILQENRLYRLIFPGAGSDHQATDLVRRKTSLSADPGTLPRGLRRRTTLRLARDGLSLIRRFKEPRGRKSRRRGYRSAKGLGTKLCKKREQNCANERYTPFVPAALANFT